MEQENQNTDNYIPNEKYDKNITSHDYDGIKELDNPAPNWLLIILFGTLFFSMIYAIQYFGYPESGNDQTNEYKNEVAEYNKASKNGKSGGATLDAAQAMAAGQKLFNEKGCIACHGPAGGGNAIGPNLTDKFWINGCSNDAVVKIITEGKPIKGMMPYKSVMSESQINYLASYILGSLVGSNPPNGKAPQGVECK